MDAAARHPIQPARSLSAAEQMRAAYWEGFFAYASGLPAYTAVFRDPAGRHTRSNFASAMIGIPTCHPEATIDVAYDRIGISVYCSSVETYAMLHEHLGEFRALAAELDASMSADPVHGAIGSTSRKPTTRYLKLDRAADFDTHDWTGLYAWHATGLLRLRELILGILS